jgi:RNase P subunit RPR2
MRFDNRTHASLEMTNGRPLCPRCRAPLWSVRVQLEDTADDKRMFQCPRCEHSHTAVLISSQAQMFKPA